MVSHYFQSISKFAKKLFYRKKVVIFFIIVCIGTLLIYHHHFSKVKYEPLNLVNDGKSLAEIAENWLVNIDGTKRVFTTELEPQQPYSPSEISKFSHQISAGLDILLDFRRTVDCQILFNPTHPGYAKAFEKAAKWELKSSEEHIWQELSESPNICDALNQHYFFFSRPLSAEEADFPLAYGLLIHSDIREMIYLIAAFYHPQNAYCIAIDGKASTKFRQQIKVFQQCFPNIHVYVTKRIRYYGPQIPVAVLSCLQKLASRKHPWKYFQYLSNVDLPLKTNLEMVRIFKALNGTFNADVERLTPDRYPQNANRKPPLPLWKSALSATFSREAANVIANDAKIYNLLLYLENATVPDETLWATIAGNPEYLKMPGGFSAFDFYTKILSDLYQQKNLTFLSPPSTYNHRFPLKSFYIARYQVWDGEIDRLGTEKKCNGSFSTHSCVFGIGDLPTLMKRPEMVAHKFYLSIQPAAFFCLYENIRLRASNQSDQESFDASYYSQLPQVQLSGGKSINDVRFFF